MILYDLVSFSDLSSKIRYEMLFVYKLFTQIDDFGIPVNNLHNVQRALVREIMRIIADVVKVVSVVAFIVAVSMWAILWGIDDTSARGPSVMC